MNINIIIHSQFFDHNLNLLNNYNKINLVPFGEFLPFENILNQLGLKTITNSFGSFSKGKKRRNNKLKRYVKHRFKFFTTYML